MWWGAALNLLVSHHTLQCFLLSPRLSRKDLKPEHGVPDPDRNPADRTHTEEEGGGRRIRWNNPDICSGSAKGNSRPVWCTPSST
ncbi:hypothetical protein GN956_G1926 [Arapaima gigas]